MTIINLLETTSCELCMKLNQIKMRYLIYILLITGLSFMRCGSGTTETSSPNEVDAKPKVEEPAENIGIGPVKNVDLAPEIDQDLAAAGKELYGQLCTACHKVDAKFIGPSPMGIMERRSPEWIMNMILNPTEMVQKDPVAKALLVEYNMAPMADQNLTEDQARKILEYFRTL